MGADGGRSRKAVDIIEKQEGVVKVYHLDGGFVGWKEKGHAVAQ